VSPDGRDGMLQHARELAERGIPFVFDPGQGLPMFDGQELSWFIERAAYVAVNDYESQLLVERTGVSLEDLARRVRALIVTRGAQGSTLFEGGKRHDVPAVAARATVDPTGCGDAYRAGLLYGLATGMDLLASGRLASVLGALKIEHAGPQNHRADRATVAERFKAAFGHPPF
jgi:adenosine kinase